MRGSDMRTGELFSYVDLENMRVQFLLGIMFALISLLHTNAYGQRHDQAPTEWRTFEVPEFGTRIQVPASIFAPAGKPERGSGQRFERADGRAVLSIYSRPNDAGENPATYLQHNLRVDRSALDYERIARPWWISRSSGRDATRWSTTRSRGSRGALLALYRGGPQ